MVQLESYSKFKIITRRYLKVLPQTSEQSLVCRLSYSRPDYVAQKCAISYSRVREILLDSLKLVLPDISGYGTHSLKRELLLQPSIRVR
jgi:hypothetical protein